MAAWVWAVIGACIAALVLVLTLGGLWRMRQTRERSDQVFEVVVTDRVLPAGVPSQTPSAELQQIVPQQA